MVLLGFQVEGQQLLAVVQPHKVGALPATGVLVVLPLKIPRPYALDLEHAGAVVRQARCAERCGDGLLDGNDRDASERLIRRGGCGNG